MRLFWAGHGVQALDIGCWRHYWTTPYVEIPAESKFSNWLNFQKKASVRHCTYRSESVNVVFQISRGGRPVQRTAGLIPRLAELRPKVQRPSPIIKVRQQRVQRIGHCPVAPVMILTLHPVRQRHGGPVARHVELVHAVRQGENFLLDEGCSGGVRVGNSFSQLRREQKKPRLHYTYDSTKKFQLQFIKRKRRKKSSRFKNLTKSRIAKYWIIILNDKIKSIYFSSVWNVITIK